MVMIDKTANRPDSPDVAYLLYKIPEINNFSENIVVSINPKLPPKSSNEPALKSRTKY